VSLNSRDKQKLLVRVRRARGQMDALERAIERESGGEAVMHLIAGVRGSMASLMGEVLELHLRAHLDDREPDAEGKATTDQLIQVFQAYLK
jgi:DNA-binding FrmR family transcriptional regulator